jgi:hypothetical protein
MARRTLSTQGRILAAGVSVAVGGALIGVMAASDHSAGASSTNNPAAASPATSSDPGRASTATPYGGESSNGTFGQAPSGDTGSRAQPQPQTRTGGS